MTMREYSEKYIVPLMTTQDRKARILKKLKKIFKIISYKLPYFLPYTYEKKYFSAFIDNQIVQRIFYLPSAVGRPTSHMRFTQTVRRIRTEGHDRQKH